MLTHWDLLQSVIIVVLSWKLSCLHTGKVSYQVSKPSGRWIGWTSDTASSGKLCFHHRGLSALSVDSVLLPVLGSLEDPNHW